MWRYEKGEHRRKHHWLESCAGFTPGKKGSVGKCPCDVSDEDAIEVLNRGIASGYSPQGWPDRLYAVYRGVIYEAVPTIPGESYHAYPWRGDLRGRPGLPKSVIKKLEEQARKEGTEKEFKNWWKKYGQ